MKGDFSRDTFDRGKHFSRVLMQQGRVQLDADWNEQSAILLHYLRSLAADLIGPFAGPEGDQFGFQIGTKDKSGNLAVQGGDFLIGKGRYYVDGILCENDVGTTYLTQPDLLNVQTLDSDKRKSYLVYLDVWERMISSLEDDYIREKALGGPDTATRAKVVWQVKLWDTSIDGTPSLDGVTDKVTKIRKNWQEWIRQESWQPPHLGCLKARVKRPADSNDPCITAPDAKYRGAENQLYRVEIHKGGREGEATFKWSRDNGAVVTGCRLEGTELIVQNPRGFSANQWVEVTNKGQELRGEPGELVKIMKVEGEKLILVTAPIKLLLPKDGPTKVRRWDHSEKGGVALENGAVRVTEESGVNSGWIDLENGIQVQFQPSEDEGGSNFYHPADYWLIAARVATGNIEWPQKLGPDGEPVLQDGRTIPGSKPPHGIRHHYAPLALLTPTAGGEWNGEDCRCQFTALNKCTIPSHGEDGMGEVPACLDDTPPGTKSRSTPMTQKVVGPPKKSKSK